jgi:hypothetical protein
LPQLAGHDALAPLQTNGLHEGLPALPAVSGVQVPVAQLPHGPQALLQQIPETQLPLWHWFPAAHDEPFGSGDAQRSSWPAGMRWQPRLHTCLTLAAPPAAAHA